MGIVKCITAGKSDCKGDSYAKGGPVKCGTCGKMNCMAHGGKAEPMEIDLDGDHDEMPMDSSVDDELMEMAADELVQALEKKDKKGIVEAIKALVMSCKE